MSSALDDSDVRALVRLLGDVAAFDADHTGKKRFLMDGLCELIQADAWVWALMCQPGKGQPQVYVNLVHGGFDDSRFAKLLKALDHPDMSWVAQAFFEELERKQTHITRTRQQIVDDAIYLKTEAVAVWAEADIGPVILSTKPLDAESGSSIAIYRKADDPLFTERDRRIAHIVLTEIPWLHRMGWPEDRGVSVPKLYPRQRMILNMLLEGMDRKTVADNLEITLNTVNGYCKEIYRHFKVNSQATLMARFYQGNGEDLP